MSQAPAMIRFSTSIERKETMQQQDTISHFSDRDFTTDSGAFANRSPKSKVPRIEAIAEYPMVTERSSYTPAAAKKVRPLKVTGSWLLSGIDVDSCITEQSKTPPSGLQR
jgi:hypothetical protein